MRIVSVVLFFTMLTVGGVFSQDTQRSAYQAYVDSLLEACRSNRGGIFAFPELEKYYDLLFNSKSISVSIVSTNSDGTVLTKSEAKVYFRQGDLFMRSAPGSKGRNYVTTNEGIYSWVEGSDSGEIYQTNSVDQAQYFSYLLDPSAIMKSFFHNYLSDKKTKNTTSDSIELEATLDGGLWNVLLAKPDLWFSRLQIVPPAKYAKPGARSEMQFDLLGTNQDIPSEAQVVPEGISWQTMKSTVASQMAWL